MAGTGGELLISKACGGGRGTISSTPVAGISGRIVSFTLISKAWGRAPVCSSTHFSVHSISSNRDSLIGTPLVSLEKYRDNSVFGGKNRGQAINKD